MLFVLKSACILQKSRILWPHLSQWAFATFKPKGTRKILFGPKGTCILQKVTYPLAPAVAMDVCQIQAKGYEENVVRAKGYVHFVKGNVPLIATYVAIKFAFKFHFERKPPRRKVF